MSRFGVFKQLQTGYQALQDRLLKEGSVGSRRGIERFQVEERKVLGKDQTEPVLPPVKYLEQQYKESKIKDNLPLRLRAKELTKKIKTPEAFAVLIDALTNTGDSSKDVARKFYEENSEFLEKKISNETLQKKFIKAKKTFTAFAQQMRESGLSEQSQLDMVQMLFPKINKKPENKSFAWRQDVDQPAVLNSLNPTGTIDDEKLQSLWRAVKKEASRGEDRKALLARLDPAKRLLPLLDKPKIAEEEIATQQQAPSGQDGNGAPQDGIPNSPAHQPTVQANGSSGNAKDDVTKSDETTERPELQFTRLDFGDGLEFIAMAKPRKCDIPAFHEFMAGPGAGVIVDLSTSEECAAQDDARYSPQMRDRANAMHLGGASNPIAVACNERKENGSIFNSEPQQVSQDEENGAPPPRDWFPESAWVEQSLSFSEGDWSAKRARLHFKGWDEDQSIGVHTLITLANQVQVRAAAFPDKPIAIHCQDGIGRTGALITFMAARKKMLAEMAKAGAENPPACTPKRIAEIAIGIIEEGQKQRHPHFIQNKEQFSLVLNALVEDFENPINNYAASLEKAAGKANDAKELAAANPGAASVKAAQQQAQAKPEVADADATTPLIKEKEYLSVEIFNDIAATRRVELVAHEIKFASPEAPRVASAGKAPSDFAATEAFLIKGFDSGNGIFQFVSPLAHKEREAHAGDKPVIDQLQAWFRKNENARTLGGRFQVQEIKESPESQHASHRYVDVVVIDLKNQKQTRTIRLTQAGLKFDGKKLDAAELQQANELMDEHNRTNQNHPGSDPMVISQGGFGRNSALIAYREAIKQIGSPADLDKITATLEDIKHTGQTAHGPGFLRHPEQIEQLRRALQGRLSKPPESPAAEASPVGPGTTDAQAEVLQKLEEAVSDWLPQSTAQKRADDNPSQEAKQQEEQRKIAAARALASLEKNREKIEPTQDINDQKWLELRGKLDQLQKWLAEYSVDFQNVYEEEKNSPG